MTLFIKIEGGVAVGGPVAEQNFRQLFKNTSFPKYFTANDVEPLGYGIYDYSSQPDLERYQKATECSPVRTSAGIWKQSWSTVEMNDAERVKVDAQNAALVRAQRNFRLSETDWIVSRCYESGDSVPYDVKKHRQALRDITNNVNFPYLNDVDWPIEP
jgi:hypothetical protein